MLPQPVAGLLANNIQFFAGMFFSRNIIKKLKKFSIVALEKSRLYKELHSTFSN